MTATPRVVIERVVEDGVGFTSKLMSAVHVGSGDADSNIWNGLGFGFMLTPIGGAASPAFTVKVRGVGKKSNDLMLVLPNTYYDCPFDALDFSYSTLYGLTTYGDFIVNIAIKPYARIIPVQPTEFPASQGGAPAAWFAQGEVDQILTRSPPEVPADGLLIGGASAYVVWLEAPGGQVITGGTLDIWRFDDYVDLWYLAAQGISVPTGRQIVGIPWDTFGPRKVVPINGVAIRNMWLPATNAITLDGAGTEVTVHWIVQ